MKIGIFILNWSIDINRIRSIILLTLFYTPNTIYMKLRAIIIVIAIICIAAGSHRGLRHSIAYYLKGSKKSQRKQNQVAYHEGLTRIKDDKQLKKFTKAKILVPISSKVRVDHRLARKFRVVRPEANKLLVDLTKAGKNRFHKNIVKVNSAVRTIAYQKKLRHRNGNAAKISGPLASSHPTGATVDIAKKGLSRPQLQWMRYRLAMLEDRGLIEVTEEHRQPVFHLMVFRRYLY